jgi:hypothetical protein
VRLPHKPLVSYKINRQDSVWILPSLMIRAFGAHCQDPTFRSSKLDCYDRPLNAAIFSNRRGMSTGLVSKSSHAAAIALSLSPSPGAEGRGLRAAYRNCKIARIRGH